MAIQSIERRTRAKIMMCGKGFGMILVLFWATALSSDLSLVSGQTVAPLTSSTSAPPKMEVKPTKPMIVNAPPKKQMPMAPEAPKLNGSKPMQVTGFITKSGNIYEIEDKRGAIGSIEGRQADEGQIVCNYGSVVIYSDVPCDKVRNVRVGEVKPLKQDPLEDNTEKNPAEGEQQSQELQPAEQQQAVAEDQSQDLEQQQDQAQPNHPRGQSQNNRRRRRRRPQQQQQQQRLQQQRRRRQQQQKLQQRRRNGNGNGNNSLRRRRNGNRNNNNNRNRQQQRRRRPNNNNNNRRRLNNNNNGQRQQQRRQQQRRRPNSNINRQQQQRRRLRDGNN